jgi:hypothetical protein
MINENEENEVILYCENCGSVTEIQYSINEYSTECLCYECLCEIERENNNAEKAYWEMIDNIEMILSRNVDKYILRTTKGTSKYYECEYETEENILQFKIRLANHSQCYDADINVRIPNTDNLDGIEVEELEQAIIEYIKKHK